MLQEFITVFLGLYLVSSYKVSAASVSKGPPVQVTVYYETLCPDSQIFITKQVWPTYGAVSDIMEIELIPYGFAKETELPNSTYSFDCQHGPDECYGNAVQTCAINLLNDTSKSLPFIYCMETEDYSNKYGRKCADKLKLDFQSIEGCVQGKSGNNWQHEMALKTENLDPPMNFVPWIVVNGKSDQDIQKKALTDLLGLVCSVYEGEKPKPCSSAS